MKITMTHPLRSFRLAALFSAALVCTAASHAATPVTPVRISHGGSTAMVDVDSPMGMYFWSPTGTTQSQLNQQWFWYRIGDTVAQPINTIGPAAYTAEGNYLRAVYANDTVQITIDYTLTGGGIGQADIAEGITITNISGAPIDFHFYQYSDFNLLGTGGDHLMMDNTTAVQWKGDTQIAEGIIAPAANHFEANTAGATLAKFDTVSGLVLGDIGEAGMAGDVDVAWAFQWDFYLQNGAGISKDKLVDIGYVPEPSSFALLGVGLALVALRRRAQV